MRQSTLFTKTRKEAPKDEEAKNAKLLIRAGYIHKEMAGVYDLLPLGFMVIEKIKNIVNEEIKKLGSTEIMMSSIQNKDTWEKTDRWSEKNVDVWFKSKLQTGSEVGFGWSHEEPITEMMRQNVMSYSDLPIAVHQFQNKLRNELRAKSGIMRCREFVMKDMYYFAKSEEENMIFYEKSIEIYKNIFNRLGIGEITYITSASGGVFTDKFSHEFQTICEAGEDNIFINKKENVAINEEVYNKENVSKLDIKEEEFERKKAVEVGNIFNFGTKKSTEMNLHFKNDSGEKAPVFLSSYGIGITRIMGVLAETFGDEKGLVWPENVAPFKYHIIEIISENRKVKEVAEQLYKQLGEGDTFYDDRDIRAGEKFADADLIGIPFQIIVSAKNIENDKIEIKNRKTGEIIIEDIHSLNKAKNLFL